MNSWSPFVFTLLGVVLGSLLNFLFNMRLQRGKRQEDWYEEIEKRVIQCEHRNEILEQRVGPLFRVIKEHMTDFLRPITRPRGRS